MKAQPPTPEQKYNEQNAGGCLLLVLAVILCLCWFSAKLGLVLILFFTGSNLLINSKKPTKNDTPGSPNNSEPG
jgi:hypothetical protein